MCIIIAKPAGMDIPSAEILDNCFTSNRDGIGFAFNKPGEIPIISKGFANVKKLQRMLHIFNVTKEHNLLIHFRLATHGACDQGNTHPFPLTSSFENMRLLHCSTECAVAHNGVFGQMSKSEKYSDTMKFINTIIASPEIIENIDSKSVKELIRGYCGFSSKLAFLKPEGFSLIGDFETEEGIHYSNRQYKSWKKYHNTDTKTYCNKHKIWDHCIPDGKTWCYIHKENDYCSWCKDHEIIDSCEHDKEQATKFITDASLNRDCEWCANKSTAKYDKSVESYLCEECTKLLSTDGKINNYTD